uniref:Right handed beta helix domain-containing protein n=1 Tax=Alexandrium monilatum TaxID=311494 RepID=A0A7S4PX37_9DINO
MAGLPLASRQRVHAYAGPAPVAVPADAPTLEAALLLEGVEAIAFSPGRHHLPRGAALRTRLRLAGSGRAELVLGAPIVVRSHEGLVLEGLTFREAAEGSRSPGDGVSALVRVDLSHVDAEGPDGQESEAKTAVLLRNCRLYGGHHALEARGSWGLRPRAGCKLHLRRRKAFPVGDFLDSARAWSARRSSRVCLVDCELVGSREEAVSAQRGACVEVPGTFVHHCGHGITISRCLDASAMISGMGPMRLRVEGSRFEDLTKHPWSAAVAVGHVGAGADAGTGLDEVEIVGCSVERCCVGVAACRARLWMRGSRLADMELGGVQLADSYACLQDNTVEGCGGAGLALASGPGPGCGLVAELRGNVVRGCDVGLRISASGASPCQLSACGDTFEGNGDAVCTGGSVSRRGESCPTQGLPSGAPRSASCTARLTGCRLLGSRRAGLRVGRSSRAVLRGCSVAGNGRGVTVAAWAAADVQGCRFEDNVGWALRLEDDAASAAAASTEAGGRPPGPSAASRVCDNVFSALQTGNVGRKRLRVDLWHEGRTATEGNVEAGSGSAVEPETKRQREIERREAEDTAQLFAGLALA